MGVPLNIDWQQILLHAFNLIILTGGLYFLLYKPVTAFMEKRQAYYAGLAADAQAKLREAEEKVQQADERLAGMQAEAEQLRAETMKEAEAEAAARLAGAEAEKQKLLAAARAQASREKDAMLREANEKLGELVSNAVDKLVSDAEDPYTDFLHTVKRGGIAHEGVGASGVRIQPHCAGGGAAARIFESEIPAARPPALGAGRTHEGRLPAGAWRR